MIDYYLVMFMILENVFERMLLVMLCLMSIVFQIPVRHVRKLPVT